MNSLTQQTGTPASRLLIHDKPLMVLPGLAARIGDRHAYVLQQIHYWLTIYQESGNERKFIDGRWWVYNTAEEWQKTNFPWLSVRTVKRILQDLEKMGLLITARFEAAAHLNQRKWYSIDYEAVAALESAVVGVVGMSASELIQAIQEHLNQRKNPTGQNGPIEQAKMERSNEPNRPVDLYTETTSTETKLPSKRNMEEAGKTSSPRPGDFSEQGSHGGETGQHSSPGQQKDQQHTPLAQGSKDQRSAAAPRQKWRLGRPLPTDDHGYAVLPREKPEVAHDWGCVAVAKAKAVLWTQRDIVELCDYDEMSLSQDEDGEYWVDTFADGEVHESESFAPRGDLPLRKLRSIAINGIRGSFLSQIEFNSILQENFEMALRQELAKYGADTDMAA